VSRIYDPAAVGQLWDDIEAAYDEHIQIPGKETHFLILLAFVCSFGFIRGSAHMIRAQVSWWPGNVATKGGTHVHHLVWGILLLISMGYVGLSFDLDDPWFELVAIAFGVGLGLTMDEFALWLNLQDVYWQEKGRQSIDAVFVTAGLLLVALLGLQFWIDVWHAVLVLSGYERRSSLWVALVLQLVGVALASVTLMKGRLLVGIAGMFVPLIALIGALLPAREGSRWQRRRARSSV
jgi:hypothetical protein